jgi:hypothetical protein
MSACSAPPGRWASRAARSRLGSTGSRNAESSRPTRPTSVPGPRLSRDGLLHAGDPAAAGSCPRRGAPVRDPRGARDPLDHRASATSSCASSPATTPTSAGSSTRSSTTRTSCGRTRRSAWSPTWTTAPAPSSRQRGQTTQGLLAAADEPAPDPVDPLGDLLARGRRELGAATRAAQVHVDGRVRRPRLRRVRRHELVQLLALSGQRAVRGDHRRAGCRRCTSRCRPTSAGGRLGLACLPLAEQGRHLVGLEQARAARGSPAPPASPRPRAGRTAGRRRARGRSARRTPAPRRSCPRARPRSRCGSPRRAGPPPPPRATPHPRRWSCDRGRGRARPPSRLRG